jgi:hypothetical protein
MAPRLAVVVSQAPMRDARVADIEESIVAELIMVSGLDATLVGPLERILPDSTDLLCLSGFTQDIALLSWIPTDDAAKRWAELDLNGTVVPMSLDGSAAIPVAHIPGRRVFYIQLTAQSVPTQVCKQLKSRLELLRVQPVSLQLKMPSPMKSPAVKPTTEQLQPPAQVTPTPTISTPSLDNAGVTTAAGKLLTDSSSSDSQWKNLDQLVDELDLLDL